MRPSHVGKTQVEQSYGNIRVHCEPDEFHRLRKILASEAAVDEEIKIPDDSIRSVMITSQPIATGKPEKMPWGYCILMLISGIPTFLAFVLGWITIARWIMDRIA